MMSAGNPAHLIRAGIVLLEHGREPEALACLNAMNPPTEPVLAGEYYLALAQAHRNLGDFPQALNTFNTGIAFDPGKQQLKYGRALLYLTLARWMDGWPEYEIRKAMQAASGEERGFHFPAWDGTDNPVFVYGEQGLGDEIMFAGCIGPVLLDRRITVECAPALVKLFRRSFGAGVKVVERTLSRDPRLSVAGNYREIAAGTLPLYAVQHGLEWLPRSPWLVPDEKAVASWRGPKHTIGISWTGGTKLTRRVGRSLSLIGFVNELRKAFPDSVLVSLQYDAVEADPEVYQPPFGAAFGDLDQTAALVYSCDLVVSVCNTNVHLAGALGVPCYCIAPMVPEWRYGLLEKMPWYSSVRVFRQQVPGDWPSAFALMKNSLPVAADVRVR